MAIQSEEGTSTGTHKCVFSGYEVIMRSRKKESNFKWRGKKLLQRSTFLSSPEHLRRDYHPVFLWFGCKILKLTTSQVLLQCMNQPEIQSCSVHEQNKCLKCMAAIQMAIIILQQAAWRRPLFSYIFFICRQPDVSLLSGCVLTQLQIDTSD